MQRLKNIFSPPPQEINPMKDNPLLHELMKECNNPMARRERINELCKSKKGIQQLREVLALIPDLQKRDREKGKQHTDELLKDNLAQAFSAAQAHEHMEWSAYYRTESILAEELARELQDALSPHKLEPKEGCCYRRGRG